MKLTAKSAFLALLLVASVQAQPTVPITTIPSPPVAGAPFIIRANMVLCRVLKSVVVNGTNIDVTFTIPPACIGTPPIVNYDIPAGSLPAGNYTIRLLLEDSTTPFATQAIVVSADIPALDPTMLTVLTATLTVLAVVRLRMR